MADREITKVTIKMPTEMAEALKALSDRTRVPQAAYFREAIEDLLKKYGESKKGRKG